MEARSNRGKEESVSKTHTRKAAEVGGALWPVLGRLTP